MRRATVLGLVLAGLFIGCGKKADERRAQPNQTTGHDKETYVHVSIQDIDSLDPAWAYDTASHAVTAHLYETLVAYKGPSVSELEPLVSEKVPSRENGLISADGRSYTFPVRKGVTFHKGEAMTPDDVAYSLKRFMLFDRAGGPAALLLEPVAGVSTTRDDKNQPLDAVFDKVDAAVQVKGDSVVLRLDKPFAPILTILAHWAPVLSKSYVVSVGGWDGTKAAWKKHNNPQKTADGLYDKPNGTGPFFLERWDSKTKEIVLGRFDAHWRGAPRLKRVVIKGVDEFQTRKLMLAAGDADSIYADRLSKPLLDSLEGVETIDDLPRIDMNPAVFFVFKVETQGNPNTGSGTLDGDGIPADFFADKDVRLAFAHAFDYEGFIKDVNRGKGSRASGFIPLGLFGHNPDQAIREFDMAKAEAHFKKAFGGKLWEKGFKFTLCYNTGNQPREVIANMIKRSVESLNPKFRIDTRGIQWSTYLDLSNSSKLPMFVLGWAPDFPDPHTFAHPFMHSQGNYPRLQRYRNAEADALVEQAMREQDPKKREKAYFRLQQIAYEDCPTLFILNAVSFRTQRKWVRGFEYNPMFADSPYTSPYWKIWKE